MSNAIQQHTVNDMWKMAQAVANSRLFGVKDPEQALALMLTAQAEGKHPAMAAKEYDIIQGKAALKADALLARFQKAGGSVEWLEYTDAKVVGKFSHPQGGSITIDWDNARAEQAGLSGKDNWRKYPRQMKRARCISEGVHTVFPACCIGEYVVEEVQDFDTPPPEKRVDVTEVSTETETETFQPSEPSRDFEPPRPVTCGFTGAGRKTPIRKQPHEMTDKELSFAVDLVQQTLDDDGQRRYHALANETLARLELEIDKRADAPTDRSETPEATDLEAALQAACEAAGVDIDEVANALELDAEQFQARLNGDGFSIGERHTLETMGLDVSSLKGAA